MPKCVREYPRRASRHWGADDADAKLLAWQGDKQIGWEVVKALQHAAALSEGVYSAYPIIAAIYDTGREPANAVERGVGAWSQLSVAIRYARETWKDLRIYGSPYNSRQMKDLWHVQNLYFSLAEVSYLLAVKGCFE